MTDAFLGEIRMVGYVSAPTGWLFCDGQTLDISNYSLLFSVISNTYGGDGVSTFALPDLRGRSPMHAGAGPGMTSRTIGDAVGTETVTLTKDQLPSHAHVMMGTNNNNNSGTSTDVTFAGNLGAIPYQTVLDNPVQFHDNTIEDLGPSNNHNNIQPRFGLNFIISVSGISP